jgi:rhodanese-related sulfurtransferase
MSRLAFITLEKLLEMKENGDPFVLIEVLPNDEFNTGHIPGAINIPVDTIAKDASAEIDQNATIVTYCANYACHASTNAARKLLQTGYRDVLDFKAGKKAWKEAGLDLES